MGVTKSSHQQVEWELRKIQISVDSLLKLLPEEYGQMNSDLQIIDAAANRIRRDRRRKQKEIERSIYEYNN